MLNDSAKNISEIVDDWFIEEPVFFIAQCMFKIEFCDDVKTVAISSKNLYINKDYADSLTKKELDMRLRLEYIRILLKHPFMRFIDSCNKELALLASEIVISLMYNKKKRVPFHILDLTETLTANDICVEDFMKSFNSSMSYEEIYRLLVSTAKQYGIPSMTIPGHDDPGSETQYWGNDVEASSNVQRIIDHIESSCNKGIGSIPGDLMELVKAGDAPYYDYSEAVRRFKRSVLKSSKRLTRMRPNRRYGYEQMGSVPSYISDVLIVCDTSGSMTTDELNACIGFANGFFSSGLASCDIVQFDTNVMDNTLCKLRRRLYEFTFYGRGGTDISDIADYVTRRAKKRYDGVVVFSDGGFELHKGPFEYMGVPIVFCITSYQEYKKHESATHNSQNIEFTYIDIDQHE